MNKNYQDILANNYGFENPKIWLDYAQNHNFDFVKHQPRKICPLCEFPESKKIGQFVYYSTLHSLNKCLKCALCYVDVLVDQDVRFLHFENAYKSESYFQIERGSIFKQIIDVVKKHSFDGTRVLDIGGATGVFLEMLRAELPNLNLILNDISSEACIEGAKKGFEVVQGSIQDIKNLDSFDIIIALDVLYYEPHLKESLDVIYKMIKPGGTLILRLPNKYYLILLWQKLRALFYRVKKTDSKIKFFNPEHLYLFSQSFLSTNLKNIGFTKVNILPSALLNQKGSSVLSKFGFVFSTLIYKIFGKVIGPAMIVVAEKK